MTSRLVHLDYSLPKGQAGKLNFFVPLLRNNNFYFRENSWTLFILAVTLQWRQCGHSEKEEIKVNVCLEKKGKEVMDFTCKVCFNFSYINNRVVGLVVTQVTQCFCCVRVRLLATQSDKS